MKVPNLLNKIKIIQFHKKGTINIIKKLPLKKKSNSLLFKKVAKYTNQP